MVFVIHIVFTLLSSGSSVASVTVFALFDSDVVFLLFVVATRKRGYKLEPLPAQLF